METHAPQPAISFDVALVSWFGFPERRWTSNPYPNELPGFKFYG
jgi:hypothetical protein